MPVLYNYANIKITTPIWHYPVQYGIFGIGQGWTLANIKQVPYIRHSWDLSLGIKERSKENRHLSSVMFGFNCPTCELLYKLNLYWQWGNVLMLWQWNWATNCFIIKTKSLIQAKTKRNTNNRLFKKYLCF